ncbi:MAG: hypothetical protein ACSHWQ_00975, partial [Spongiibacteraceae bacterium]
IVVNGTAESTSGIVASFVFDSAGIPQGPALLATENGQGKAAYEFEIAVFDTGSSYAALPSGSFNFVAQLDCDALEESQLATMCAGGSKQFERLFTLEDGKALVVITVEELQAAGVYPSVGYEANAMASPVSALHLMVADINGTGDTSHYNTLQQLLLEAGKTRLTDQLEEGYESEETVEFGQLRASYTPVFVLGDLTGPQDMVDGWAMHINVIGGEPVVISQQAEPDDNGNYEQAIYVQPNSEGNYEFWVYTDQLGNNVSPELGGETPYTHRDLRRREVLSGGEQALPYAFEIYALESLGSAVDLPTSPRDLKQIYRCDSGTPCQFNGTRLVVPASDIEFASVGGPVILWAFIDVDEPSSATHEPASGYFSAIKNGFEGYRIADQMDYMITPVYMESSTYDFGGEPFIKQDFQAWNPNNKFTQEAVTGEIDIFDADSGSEFSSADQEWDSAEYHLKLAGWSTMAGCYSDASSNEPSSPSGAIVECPDNLVKLVQEPGGGVGDFALQLANPNSSYSNAAFPINSARLHGGGTQEPVIGFSLDVVQSAVQGFIRISFDVDPGIVLLGSEGITLPGDTMHMEYWEKYNAIPNSGFRRVDMTINQGQFKLRLCRAAGVCGAWFYDKNNQTVTDVNFSTYGQEQGKLSSYIQKWRFDFFSMDRAANDDLIIDDVEILRQ